MASVILTSRIAKDLELLITRTKFNPVTTKRKLDIYVELGRITQEEYEYLLSLIEKELAEDTAKELEKIK